MWARDFLAADTRVKGLKTHLKANNPFLRWYTREYYLPEEMRLSATCRTCRLINTLMVYTAVVVSVIGARDSDYAKAV